MRTAKRSNPTDCRIRYRTREPGGARLWGDGWWKRHGGFVKEEEAPVFGVSVVSGRAAAEFVRAVVVPKESSVAERGNKADAPRAIQEVRFHGHSFRFTTAPSQYGPGRVHRASAEL